MKTTRRTARLQFAALATGLALIATGCSSPSTPVSTAGETDIGKAQAVVDQYTGPYEGGIPTIPVPPATGVSALVIPCSMAAEGCRRLADGTTEALKELGWQTQLIDPAGDPSRTNAALEQALTLKPDVVFLDAVEYDLVSESVKRLQDAGILVVGAAVAPDSPFDWVVPQPNDVQGDAMAAYVAAESGGSAKVATFELTGFSTTQRRNDAFKPGLKEYCPSCEIVSSTQFAVTDMGGLAAQVKAVLAAHPEIDWIHADFDGSAAVIVPAVAEAGRASSVKVVGYDGNLQNIEFIRSGEIEVATFAQAVEWEAWQSVYAANALLQGITPERTPDPIDPAYRILTVDNLPAKDTAYEGDIDFRAAYRELWGK